MRATALALALTGCISSAPIVPETPQNQAQIASCQSTAALHNDVVIGDFIFGGATTALSGVGALLSDSTAKNDAAIAAAITGGLAVIGTAVAGFSAANFADSQCSTVVGSLPAVATAAKPGVK